MVVLLVVIDSAKDRILAILYFFVGTVPYFSDSFLKLISVIPYFNMNFRKFGFSCLRGVQTYSHSDKF